MNFMIRSYKFFQSNRLKMVSDDLFNKSFMSMKEFLVKPDLEQYIPDFVQVFLELLAKYMNSNDINGDTLCSPMKILFKKQIYIPNIMSSLSYSFLLYSLVSQKTKDWSFLD